MELFNQIQKLQYKCQEFIAILNNKIKKINKQY